MYNGGGDYILRKELKDRQCMYDVKVGCFRATITAVEKQ